MNPITKVLSGLTRNEYYEKHLYIINQFLPVQITKKEIEVLSGFMALQGDIVQQDRFGTQARKIIMENLEMSGGGLGNHLKSLKDKGFIQEVNGKLEINKFLLAEDNGQMYQFKINQNV